MKSSRQIFPVVTIMVLACAGAALRAQPTADTNVTAFAGTVVDSAGQPVAGAAVEYWSSGEDAANPFLAPATEARGQAVMTGADGTFTNQISPGAGVLMVQKAGFAPAWKQLGLPFFSPRNEGDKQIILTPPGVLSGVVTDASNQPVAQAEVYVMFALAEKVRQGNMTTFNYLSGKLAREKFSTKTDAAGRFRLENFPTNAAAMLAVNAPGKVLRPEDRTSFDITEQGYRAGQNDIKLVVEPAGGIEGRLIAGDKTQTLPVAHLTLQPDEPGGFMLDENSQVTSDPNGGFHFDRVLAGDYRLQASFGTNNPGGWVAEATPVTVAAGQILRGAEVKVVKGSLLEAVVLDADHKPQPKANVVVYLNNMNYQGISGADGVARLFVLPGDYQVSAFHQSLGTGQAAASVEAGQTNRVEITLAARPGMAGGKAASKLTGVIHAPDGQPAVGVSIQLVGGHISDGEALQTDAQGRFELDWNTQNFGASDGSTICFLARDPAHNLAVAVDWEEGVTNLDLTLAPALTLFGRVEAGGKPLTNATAQLVFWSGNRGMWLRGLASTNIPGKYEIPALPPGRRYGVVVSAPGYGQKANHNLEISAEPGRQELDPVELKPANLKLAGQVLDADDQPVKNCYVNLYGEDQPSANVRTDKEGRFAFKQVCEGTVRLSANSQRAHGSVSAEGGDTNVVLKLGETMSYSSDSKPHKLKGVVTDASGQPAAGVQVAVFPNSGARWTKTGTNGEYSLTWSLQSWQMQNGGATLVLRDQARNLAATEELPEETTNLNVQLKPALTLAGQVKNEDGAPLPAAQIGFWLKSGNSYGQMEPSTITADATGRFEIKCLPMSGEYIVWATAKGYGKRQQPLHPEYETNHVELDPFALKRANLLIAGQVLKDDDKPASGVNVNLNGEGQPDGNLTTDSQGRFHFKVCEGQINLYAYSQSGSGNAQATVEAGDTNIVMTLSSSSSGQRQPPRRAALKGGSLPDLTSVNLAADAALAGQPVLLCLFDAGQRPSRHVIGQLNQQAAALKEKNICVIGVQAVVIADDAFNAWKEAKPMTIPIGRVTEKSAKTKWATSASALPWLILADANHKVVAEGFALDEVESQVQKMAK